MNFQKLPREFYTRQDTLLIARELLGKLLVVPAPDGSRVSGIIVETEAYLGVEDKASHSFGNRRTNRTETMYAQGGTAYVYFIYGMYYQLNAVTNIEGTPHAVLIRAVEPREDLDMMHTRRPVKRERDLTSGPGKLCIAFGIDRTYNRENLTTGERIWIEDCGVSFRDAEIATGPRIGIGYAEEFIEKPWRFWVKNNVYVSRG